MEPAGSHMELYCLELLKELQGSLGPCFQSPMARPMVQAPVPSTSSANPSVGDSEGGGPETPSQSTSWLCGS